jgi:hypothetical protein
VDVIRGPSLVLDLPLYEPDGSSFVSKDAFGPTGVVSGALWTPQGRIFDGDDKINVTSGPGITGQADRTLEVWVKAGKIDFSSLGHVAAWGIWNNHQYFGLVARGNPATWQLADGYTYYDSLMPVSVTAFHHVSVTFTGAGRTAKIYVNGVQYRGDKTLSAGTNTAGGTPVLGSTPVNSNYFSGVTGEVRIYNRALSSMEIRHNYLAKKWRYQ